jgi:hypothetical protein
VPRISQSQTTPCVAKLCHYRSVDAGLHADESLLVEVSKLKKKFTVDFRKANNGKAWEQECRDVFELERDD